MLTSAVVIIIVIGFRREVGGDWWNYLDIFNKIKGANLIYALTKTDPGYGLVNWIAAERGWGIWFPNLVCAVIFTSGLIALCRQQPNPALAVVASMYLIILMGMGFTRQSAALGFVMLAIAQYTRGATIRTLMYLGLATLFHTSAVFAIPLLGLAAARRGLVVAAMIILLGAVLAFQFAGTFQDRYSLYTSARFVSAGALPRLAMIVLPAAVFLSFRRRFTADPAELRLWTVLSLASFALLTLLLALGLAPIVDRLAFYLSPLQIFVLSRVPNAFGGKGRPNMFLLILVILYSLAIEVGWLTLGRWGHAWIPYQNYLWDFARDGEWSRDSRAGRWRDTD